MMNTSKCYLKNNLVLDDVHQIKDNSQVNDYLVDIIRTGKKVNQPQLPDDDKDDGLSLEVYSRSNR